MSKTIEQENAETVISMQTRIEQLQAKVKEKDELLFAYDLVRSPIIDKTIINLQAKVKALEEENEELKKKTAKDFNKAAEVLLKSIKEKLQAELDKKTKALEDKIVKCCRTCDSFITHTEAKKWSVSIPSSDGDCPFDSKEHYFTDSCKNWNIETLPEQKP